MSGLLHKKIINELYVLDCVTAEMFNHSREGTSNSDEKNILRHMHSPSVLL